MAIAQNPLLAVVSLRMGQIFMPMKIGLVKASSKII